MDVTYFPYDEQKCALKFLLWSYDQNYVSLNYVQGKLLEEYIDPEGTNNQTMQYSRDGMDKGQYKESPAWHVLNNTAWRHEKIYASCCGLTRYCDITYYLTLSRKTIFFTVNLTIPCVLVAILIVFVFYLPSDAQEKMTLSISILITIAMLFLLLNDIIPPTSVSVAMAGKYLVFMMVLATASVGIAIVQLNFIFKEGFHEPVGKVHLGAKVRKEHLFCQNHLVVSDYVCHGLYLTQPQCGCNENTLLCSYLIGFAEMSTLLRIYIRETNCQTRFSVFKQSFSKYGNYSHPGFTHVFSIKKKGPSNSIWTMFVTTWVIDWQITEDWLYLARIIDRFSFVIFMVVFITGTIGIIFQAPQLTGKH